MTLNKQLLIAFIIIAILFTLPNLQKPDISEQITLLINAIVIRDSENAFTSERNRTNIENLLDKVNGVWLQTNISFELKSVNFIDVDTSLMKDMWETPEKLSSLQNFDTTDVNVLFIRNTTGANGVSFPEHKIVIMPDRTTNREEVALSHELGHILGLDHVPDSSYLMFSVCNGTKTSFYEIQIARKVAKSLLP